ncbi:hypothetical protein RP319_03045 [Heyndrickxia coagulans]|uniref:hypothetical protein n=1 Tax=Heyndrickxia coagulans TaxID=1398 RepID=UPI0028FB8D25|nr:hypothetical protein [Heyndrickxia coagulans]MDT9755164.1 hypothetical protein [Heyndrickxia coagulans]
MGENKKQGKMDNPEQFATENEDMHDKFMSEQTVDPIPMEDLREEKTGHDKKTTSSSEKKYKP